VRHEPAGNCDGYQFAQQAQFPHAAGDSIEGRPQEAHLAAHGIDWILKEVTPFRSRTTGRRSPQVAAATRGPYSHSPLSISSESCAAIPPLDRPAVDAPREISRAPKCNGSPLLALSGLERTAPSVVNQWR